jgi:outer membrane protein assembly factor BamB
MIRPATIGSLVALLLAAADASAQDWSRFRGPNGSGVSASRGLPLEFGPATHVIWTTGLPVGYSSPIFGGDRIFLTGARDSTLVTIAIDRATGKIFWERDAPRDRTEKLDPRNGPASPSPATDGAGVFVFFADYGLLAYEADGRERWRLPLGPFNNVYGMGASPVVVGDLVVLVCDQSTNSFILAVDKRTGAVRWRTPRPEAKSGHSTPIVYQSPGGATEILVPGSFMLTAYSTAGEKLWWVGGLSFEMKSTPVIEGDTLYINGFGAAENQPDAKVTVPPTDEIMAARDADRDGKLTGDELPDRRARTWASFMDLDGDGGINAIEWDYYRAALATENGMLAIRLGGRGDMTGTAVRWKYQRAVPQLPSPLLYQGVLYMVNDGGIVTSFKPDTGEVIAQGRLKGAIDKYFASPVAADGKIFMVSETGKVAVLRPSGQLDPVAVNDLGEECYATPAIVDGRIYIRTKTRLFAFGQPREGR